MLFVDLFLEDDVALLGLFQRYEEEPEELKKQVLLYISNPAFTAQAVDVLASPKPEGFKQPQEYE